MKQKSSVFALATKSFHCW